MLIWPVVEVDETRGYQVTDTLQEQAGRFSQSEKTLGKAEKGGVGPLNEAEG